MDSRDLIKKGGRITLCEETTGETRTFTIMSKDGEGSSSVSYIASYGKKTGRLKEFYPCGHDGENLFGIVRGKDNQLSVTDTTDEALDRYNAMLRENIESYHILEDAKNAAKKGRNSFGTFIPSFEIYRGRDENGNPGGSAYIWTVDNTGYFKTFKEYLEKVHDHPSRNPAKALYVILKTLYNLTECIKTLHSAGLIHGDIKPDNFGFSVRDGRYLTEQVQLFDINSICPVHAGFPAFTRAHGYFAPEIAECNITKQSDLYSIGAVLFNAVALTDDIPDGLFRNEYYDCIDEIVADSKLLNGSPITSGVKFQTAIARILKKCLAVGLNKRISDCDELKEDLRRACVLLLPAQYNDVIDLGSELKIIDKKLEQFNEADSAFAIRSLLFNNPLYKDAGDTIKVLVAGFGVYGQQFLDICLQAGQIKDKKLEITVVTCDKEASKKEYLLKRPALLDFFEIDGDGDRSATQYGKIFFLTPAEVFDDEEDAKKYASGFSKTNLRYNKALAKEIMHSKCESNYVFIALGDDKLNRSAAKACAEVVTADGLNCTVACVCKDNGQQKGFFGVDVTSRAYDNLNYENIERMAFNAHLAWSSPLKMNVNLKKIRKSFADKYNHDSSVACVLAIKNFLFACGIRLDDLSEESLAKAAKEYLAYILKVKGAVAELVHMEHRRWVVDKITAGWTCRKDLSSCLHGPVNDRKKKLHPCIVKSNPDFNLVKLFKDNSTRKWITDKWNTPCAEDKQLDSLDTVSVKLHRVFFKAAEEIRSTYSIDGEEADKIRLIIGEYKEAVIAFNEWMICMMRIWDMDEAQTRFYEGYKDAFNNALEALPKQDREEVIRYAEIIDSKMETIIAAYRMRDYKASDEHLVRSIPFILTNRDDRSLFIPMMTGDNTAVFNNVAAPTVVNPETVIYGAYLKDAEEMKKISDAVDHILLYMDKKDIKSRVKFVFVYKGNGKDITKEIDGWSSKIKGFDARIRQVICIPVERDADIATAIEKNVHADAYENNAAYLSALLVGAGFYENRPQYSFDSSEKKFTTSDDCRWMSYIRSGQCITVADMLAFRNSVGEMTTLPQYTGFKELWNLYKYNSYAWKEMCEKLELYSEGKDKIAEFGIREALEEPTTIEFIIPDELRESYNRIISYLRDTAHVLGETSRVEYNTVESCKAVVTVGKKNTASARKLFADPCIFISPKDIRFNLVPSKTVTVYVDKMVVDRVSMEECDNKSKIAVILTKLQELGYIHHLWNENYDNKIYSFVYSTRQAKQLMITAGRMLEVFVYHMLQSSGFDDVVSGYDIVWNDTGVKSEIDCIVTSGFKSAIIECKAQPTIKQEFYFKISSQARQFGINTVPVLIADTHESPDRDNSVNKMQRERGKMLGVVTVCKSDDISDIATTLRSIFNGKYDPED